MNVIIMLAFSLYLVVHLVQTASFYHKVGFSHFITVQSPHMTTIL